MFIGYQRKTMWSPACSCRRIFLVAGVQYVPEWLFAELVVPENAAPRKSCANRHPGHR